MKFRIGLWNKSMEANKSWWSDSNKAKKTGGKDQRCTQGEII